MHSAWVKDTRLRVKCIELSLSLHHLSSPQDTCSIPRVYAVMRGGAISFSFHRRCGIYVLLIHSDIFFYASNDRSMLIPFSSKTEVAGRWRTQGLGGKYNLEPRGGSVEIFHPTVGPDLGVAQAPSYLCEGKETASVAYASSGAAG